MMFIGDDTVESAMKQIIDRFDLTKPFVLF